MRNPTLTPEDREFLALVSQAAFANPFGEDRLRLDNRLASSVSSSAGRNRQRDALLAVHGFLEKLGARDLCRGDGMRPEDRDLIETACLFDVFHEFMGQFDSLIGLQTGAGDTPCSVDFSQSTLDRLNMFGFAHDRSVRFFAMFYQLRRAFFFVRESLIGDSPSMRQFRKALWNNVFTTDIRMYEHYLWNRMEDFSTLLLGETGTGKGAAASAIGRSGFIPFDLKNRRFAESFQKSFIAINLSQFTESLIESELFGHRKGAFTGAMEAYDGVFARCSPHGAIFVDEIGEVSVPIQIKLLEVLQERVFSPVGSHEKKRFHGRVIAASNRHIGELRRSGKFRDDFFYRLCSDVITVPPLRQRIQENPGELSVLVTHVVQRILGHDSPELASLVEARIDEVLGRHYPWPGNVRELEQCVRRILLTGSCEGDATSAAPDLRTRLFESMDAGKYSARDLVADYCKLLHARHGTYEEVGRLTGLDRRTVKKYVGAGRERRPAQSGDTL